MSVTVLEVVQKVAEQREGQVVVEVGEREGIRVLLVWM